MHRTLCVLYSVLQLLTFLTHRRSCRRGALLPCLPQCVFHKYKDIVLHDHRAAIKTWKLTLIQCYHLDHKPYSNFISDFNNDLYVQIQFTDHTLCFFGVYFRLLQSELVPQYFLIFMTLIFLKSIS